MARWLIRLSSVNKGGLVGVIHIVLKGMFGV
jgi:hypothetical protein